MADEETLDEINKLPESLLVQIISLLPIKDAFKTSLVSKKWQHLWTCTDNLVLLCNKHSEAEDFVSFVDQGYFWSIARYNFNVKQWLTCVIENQVEDIKLESVFSDMYTLPQMLYTCSSLRTLSLFDCAFDLRAIISWKSLKKLKLEHMKLYNEVIVKLLSDIKVKDIWPEYEEGDHTLEIVAPYIQHLEISSDIDDFKCRLVNVSSLVTAEITFDIRCESDIQDDYEYVLERSRQEDRATKENREMSTGMGR
ncbi:putative F-box/FBD/LRR-repeat protein At1g78760 [Solanum tuberosum]|uniref:putative F-box/FBD/LRR-repeat protein At1g78760 n=1 Tax=Solanum tuberosum TaxID=4113 RepID=UPI00073A46B0|nr:PREDICTED: putative F-box/FBD/LRR-repeat protein At1g78760 [Solanum tuberosum]